MPATGDDALLEMQAQVLLVDCPPPPAGCGNPVGEWCTSTSRNPYAAGKPLRRPHPARMRRAGITLRGDDTPQRCRVTALPVAECDHCKRRPHRLGVPIVALYGGRCGHCHKPWRVGAPIVRVVGGGYTHADCAADPPDDDDG
jgi:hypothetical protein